jgi:hypothetical protein
LLAVNGEHKFPIFLGRETLGRPSKFKEKFCQDLITHMTSGADFRSFAGKCDVVEGTLYEWLKVHKSFAEAHALAVEKCYAWWEAIGRKGLYKDQGIDVGMFVINMRNRFKWLTRDKDDDKPPESPDAFSEHYRTWEKRKSDR